MNRLLPYVPPADQEKIKKYKFHIDQKLSLYSKLLLRLIACQVLDVNNREITVSIGEYGKPFLRDCPAINFNISHTKNAIVVAASSKSVGVDVEKIKRADRGIANRFFRKNEAETIEQADKNADDQFYEIWTKKEAYLKYCGKGLSLPLDSFDVFEDDFTMHSTTFRKGDYLVSVYGEDAHGQFEFVECYSIDRKEDFMNTEKYIVDEEHILHRQVAGCEVPIRFCKEENPMIKELVIRIRIDAKVIEMKLA